MTERLTAQVYSPDIWSWTGAFFPVCFKRVVRYVRVGFWLHLVALFAGAVFVFACKRIVESFQTAGNLEMFFSFYCCLVSLSMVLFAQKDAFCRFQNYKRAKDLFFENGFDTRIVDVFIHSRCQRDAVLVAACDTGHKTRLTQYYAHLGYRWYHFLPDIVFNSPGAFFRKPFWKKTLFVPYYRSRHFLW